MIACKNRKVIWLVAVRQVMDPLCWGPRVTSVKAVTPGVGTALSELMR